jgi:predicted nucleic acid-binding protein
LDTSFLIDLVKERRAGDGPAHRFLQTNLNAELALSTTALGELAEGFGDEEHPVFLALRRTHRLLDVDEEVALAYGRITRELRSRGALIGTNDLWIAATALRYGLPVVTADVEHFGRVEGLEVVSYR